MQLTAEQIEVINSYGPYNHSTWSVDGLEISNEERLSGRGQHLVETIRKSLTDRFKYEEISNLTIADVGCYDGWILHELSDLPFMRMVGIEPRKKNLDKGENIRKILGIETRIEFVQGDITTLMNEKFDIVLCLGVIHHLESTALAIKQLRAGCRRFLFVETICLSSSHISKKLHKEIEMKDLVYRFKEKICGLSGHKFESSYYDGSASNLSIVNIPSIETLYMNLELYFTKIKVLGSWESYRKVFKKYDRQFNAVYISAEPEKKTKIEKIEKEWFENYESDMITTTLNPKHVKIMYDYVILKKKVIIIKPSEVVFCLYLLLPNRLSGICKKILNLWYKEKPCQELIANMRHNIPDKLTFEYGKILYYSGQLEYAIEVLKKITGKVNADWRSVYRSFYLLCKIYRQLEDIENSEKYRQLCQTANPHIALDTA